MTPSKYQEGIYDWIQTGSGGARVDAVAGSGKTTTLVGSSDYISGTSLFCAFNKHIENALSQVLRGSMSCKTIHSIGMGALFRHIGKVTVEADKYKDICDVFGMEFSRRAKRTSMLDPDAIKTPGKAKKIIMNLTRMAMVTLTDPEDHEALLKMAKLYCIRVPESQREQFFNYVPKVIDRGNELTRDGKISFDDMIYYPAVNDLNCKEHLWVLVDEAQDLSAAQLAIVKNSLKSRGRMIAVGDPLQSLYGFTGADPWSFSRIAEYAATDLPLSICYRCSNSVVDLASLIVPQIEAADNARDGEVRDISEKEFTDMVEPGDMVVCRTNAPLVETIISLISSGKKAYMKGSDLMTVFLDVVAGVVKDPGYSWSSFRSILMTQKGEILASLDKDGDDSTARFYSDIYDAVDACVTKLGCHNERQLQNRIKELFREDENAIVCSSVHKAKGLESERVFIINPSKIRLRWKDQLEWQEYQEQCCEYVAITRAKENLYMVVKDGEQPYSVGRRIKLPKMKS